MISIRDHNAYKSGVVLAKQGEFNQALDKFKEILSSNPRAILDILMPLYRQLALQQDDFELRAFIADLCIWGKLYGDAFVELEELFWMSPDFSKTYFLLGKLYKKKQNHPKIKYLLEEAFQLGVLDSTVLDILPGLYLEEKNINKSILIFEKLVQERSGVFHYAKTLAGLYEEAGRFEEAVKQYDILVDRSPTCMPEAVEFCEKVMKYSPKSFLIRKMAIKFNMKACNPLQAIVHMQVLLASDPEYVEEAIQTYKHILDLYPDTPDVLLELAKVLIQVERYSEAVTCLRHVFDHAACDEALLKSYLNLILSKYPNQHMALQLLIEIASKNAEYQEVLTYVSGMIDLNVVDDTPIEESLSTVIQQAPQHQSEARYQLQRYFFNQQDFEKSIEMGEVLAQSGVVVKSVLLRARAFEKKARLDLAVGLLRDTLTHRPFETSLHRALQETVFSDLSKTIHDASYDLTYSDLKRGSLYLAQGNLDLASEQFQKVLPEAVDYPEAQLLLNRCFVEMGRLDLAIHQMMPLLDLLPPQSEQSKEMRFVVGIQLIQAGQVVEGLTVLEKILHTDIQFPFVQNVLGQYQKESVFDFRGKLLSGCFDQPGGVLRPLTFRNREVAKSAGAQTMSFAQSHNNQGVDYALKGHYQSAKEAFQVALELDPSLTAVICNLAMVAMAQGEKLQAAVLLDQALSLNKKWDVVYLNKALLAMQSEDFESALAFCKSARALNPENPFIKLLLGDIYSQLGDLKQAFLYWHQASHSGMVYPYLQRRLGYLVPDSFNLGFKNHLFLNVPSAFLVG